MIAILAPTQSLADRLLAADDDDRRALIDADGLDPREMHDAVLALIAEVERVMGSDVRRMERLSLAALALAERTGDDYLRGMATMRYGEYLRVAGRNAEACDRFDAAAAIFTRLDRPVEAARTRVGWVWSTAKLGRPDEALAVANRARKVLVEHGEAFRAAILDGSIAQLHMEGGDHRSALRANTRALVTFRSLAGIDPRIIGGGHAGRALALTRGGRYAEAFREYRAARAIYETAGEVIGTARVTRNMGEAEMEIGRYAAALRSFEAARAVFRTAALHGEAAQVAPALVDCYLHLNRPAEALIALDEAEDDLRRTDAIQAAFAVALRRVAAYLLLGDRARAVAILDETEGRYPTGASHHRAWLAEQRATLALRDGDAAESLLAARSAFALARATGAHRRMAAAVLIEGGALLALGDLVQAERAALRAGRLARAVDAAPALARSHELLGRLAERQNRAAVARRRYARAIEQLEREQRGVIFEFRDSFAAARGTAYARLAGLQLEAGRPADALRTAERAKSRALADVIAGTVELRPRGSPEARRLARAGSRARRLCRDRRRRGAPAAGIDRSGGARARSSGGARATG